MRKAKKRTTGPGRPYQLELPLPMDPRQAFREEIERSQTVPRQARAPKPLNDGRRRRRDRHEGGHDHA